jgi:3-hydroxyisobutyrate dehydrogenase-like beta-hydroxyacid dehydrogenase
MQSIGFVGLGVMGGPMASNLLGNGFRVTGQDLRGEAVDQLVNQGGSAAERLEDLAGCDAVIVMVNTDEQAREVIGALISHLRERPRPIISMATILPSTIRELGETANAAGIGLLDAPVSGGPIVAQLGGLAIMVGGDPALFEEARPAFAAMGSVIRHVGPLGAGLTVKLVNNMISISAVPLALEALRIGLAQGMDLPTMVEVIRASSGNTWLTQEWEQAKLFLEFALRDPSQLDALVKTGLKDMQLAASFCARSGIDAPLLQNSIRSLEQQGAEGLRSNLAAVIEALRASSGGTA